MATPTIHATIAELARMPVQERTAPLNAWTAERREDVAAIAGELAMAGIAAAGTFLERGLEATTAKDGSMWTSAARNSAVVAGILVDKAQILTGQATQRVERLDVGEARTRLAELLGLSVLDVPSALADSTEGTPSAPPPPA